MNTIFDKIKIYNIFLVGIFVILALPILELPPWFFPPSFAKTIVFRTLLAVLIFLIIWSAFYKKGEILQRKINWKSPLFSIFLSLGGVYLLATFFSIDPNFSFWGSPLRAEGALNFLFFIFFAILISLTIKNNDWKRIWGFSFVIGVLVSLFGIFQYFKLLSNIIVPTEGGVSATTGYSGFMAIYIMVLFFMALSFGLLEKTDKKKLYFYCLPVFIFSIIITGARATYLAAIIAVFYYLLSKPVRKLLWQFFEEVFPKKIKLVKIITGVILLALIAGIVYLNLPNKILPNNKIVSYLAYRLSIKQAILDLTEARFSAWKIGIEGIKEKPIFGWGPENFQTVFGKYYSPFLPGMDNRFWWDRAHNFLVEYAINAGVPFLILFILFTCLLFWHLQKAKKSILKLNNNSEIPILIHGIQAALIGYFTALLFTFEGFVTQLPLFLIFGYSFYITAKNKNAAIKEKENIQQKEKDSKAPNQTASAFFSIFAICILIWFVWVFNIKPLMINSVFARAGVLKSQGGSQEGCKRALSETESILAKKSILDAYVRLKYAGLIQDCPKEVSKNELYYAKKGAAALKEFVAIQPKFAKVWIVLNAFTNVLISKESDPESLADLTKQARLYLATAEQLSPNRPEIFIEQLKTDFVAKDISEIEKHMQKCLQLSMEAPECYWYYGLTQINSGNKEEGEKNINIAQQKGFSAYTGEQSLKQLIVVYTTVKDYQKLVDIYKIFIRLHHLDDFQYYANLAFIYKELGRYAEAKEAVESVIRIAKDNKEVVDEAKRFLKTIPQ